MSSWRRCATCRKVRPLDEFEPDALVCRPCATSPVRSRPASPVTRSSSRGAPAPAAAPRTPAGPRLGSVGSGDLEVRERRARRAALDALADLHPDEYADLLRSARRAEGLRAPGE